MVLHPLSVATAFRGEYDPATAAHVEWMKHPATPVDEGLQPITALIDDPPAVHLTAYVRHRRISLDQPMFSDEDAVRLGTLTEGLLHHAPHGT